MAANIRERILELVSEPSYVPATERELAQRLRLKSKADRREFGHELKRLLGNGGLVLIKKDRICLPQDADLVTGKINFRQSGSAVLLPPRTPGEPERPAVDISAEDTGVAMHGDQVVVRLYEHPRQSLRPRPGTSSTGLPARRGRVIRVLQRARESLSGNLQRTRLFYFVVPDDPRQVHDIYVPDPAKSGLRPAPKIGDKVVVKLHDWVNRHVNPEGEIVEVLGRTHEPRAEFAAILHKFKLETSFPPEVEAEAAALPDRVLAREMNGRQDLRQLPTFTIDPDDAKDFDDALSVENLKDGGMRIGIHIADVSAYVKPQSALDREAQRRGNSTYLVGSVIPMLPFKLSNGLCSLKEGEDRLTKSVFLTFSRGGRLKETQFGNTVIRSRKRLTYRQAYALLKEENLAAIRKLPLPAAHQTGSTGKPLSSLEDTELRALQSWVRQLWEVASRLRRDRMKNGSLDMDMPEVKIFVDAQGYADRIEKIEYDESHQLIEEFMLAANEAVARVTRQNNLPSLYRVHDDPDEEKLHEYREFLATFGVTVGDLTQRSELVRLLRLLRTHPQGYTLRTQLLRSLRRAQYRATPDGHFGLNKNDYTHFTSPIRRYADLVVHRVFAHFLVKHLGQEPPAGYQPGFTAAHAERMGEHLSITEQNSTEAERESVKVKLLEFFEREAVKKKKTHFRAVITEVRNHGFFIELVESMAFGLVHVSSLRDDLYRINPAGTALVGRRTHHKLELGQHIEVVVERVDRFKRQIDFHLA